MRRRQNERERGGVDFAFLMELIERRELKDERLRGENKCFKSGFRSG
jgi:hypothetical protein